MESKELPTELAWGHWLSIGLNILLLCIGTGPLVPRYPALLGGWLLANVAYAIWRLYYQPMWQIERQLLKPFIWLACLPAPLLVLGACLGYDDTIIFRDADTTIRQHRTEFSFGGGPDEEEIVTTHYRTRYLLYEEETHQESKPAQGGR